MRIDQELASLMVGKTVIAVDPPCAGEAVAKFTLSDGTSFRLHATELGAWVEKTVASGGLYRSLDFMYRDYGHYTLEEPEVALIDGRLVLEAPDGTQFIGVVDSFPEEDRKVVAHSKGFPLIAFAAQLGPMWRAAFSPKYYPDLCPLELARESGT